MLIRKLNLDDFQRTGECSIRMLYPWDDVVDTPFGSGWTHLAPGETMKRHQHHELETYFVAYGHGEVSVDQETTTVGPGDVLYVPPFHYHVLRNTSADENMLFLSVYWEDMTALRTPKPEVAPAARSVRILAATSGTPRLAAAAHARFLRMQGFDASIARNDDASNDEATDADAAVQALIAGLHTAAALAEHEGRLVFPLAPHTAALRRYYAAARIGPEVRAVCERLLDAGLPAATVSHDEGTGCIPLTIPGFESQWTDPDLAAAAAWAQQAQDAEVCFFDTADARRYGLLFPALLFAADPPRQPPRVLIASEACDPGRALQLADTPVWLQGVSQRLREEFDNVVPVPGMWTEEQHHFYERLKDLVAEARRAYGAEAFSLEEASRAIDRLLWTTHRFTAREQAWIGMPDRDAERRTTLVLLLTAAKTLAMLSAPLRPSLAAQLWHDLGYDGDLPPWEDVPTWIPAGRRLQDFAATIQTLTSDDSPGDAV